MSTTNLTDRDAAIRLIRDALKRRSGHTWSVTGGRGTAWGWIEISVPPSRRHWHHVVTTTPEPPTEGAVFDGMELAPGRQLWRGFEYDDDKMGPLPASPDSCKHVDAKAWHWWVFDPSKPFGMMGPGDCRALAKLLGMSRPIHPQGESIPASSDYRREYIDRAEMGRAEEAGEPYWD